MKKAKKNNEKQKCCIILITGWWQNLSFGFNGCACTDMIVSAFLNKANIFHTSLGMK